MGLTKTLAVLGALLSASSVVGKGWPTHKRHNLTPDGYWHNRYHMILGMALYGDYDTTCPNETFTEASKLQNFPDSSRPPWQVVNTFGPTPSGCKGFTAIIPEMNKALIIFSGDYALEQVLPHDVTPWSDSHWNGTAKDGTTTALPTDCNNCSVNKFALQGYLECKEETNDWAEIKAAWAGQGLVFSITGHGLGGMHSQIASIDLFEQEICWYSHAHGSPRVFNQAGSDWYGERFNGEAGERGISGNDQYTEFIPEGPDYAHTGTPFYYWGFNSTSLGMNMRICWIEDGMGYDDCMPQDQGQGTAEQDHYFYFTPVTDCGGENQPDHAKQDAFINAAKAQTTSAAVTLGSTSSIPSSTSTPPPVQTTQPAASDTGSSGASPILALSFTCLLALGSAAIFSASF